MGKGGINNAKNQRNHIAGVFRFTVILYFIIPQAMRLTQLTLQRGETGTARMLHALTHSSISRQVREQM